MVITARNTSRGRSPSAARTPGRLPRWDDWGRLRQRRHGVLLVQLQTKLLDPRR
jgi:hypothetical protein